MDRIENTGKVNITERSKIRRIKIDELKNRVETRTTFRVRTWMKSRVETRTKFKIIQPYFKFCPGFNPILNFVLLSTLFQP